MARVKSDNERTSSKVRLSCNRLNAAYDTCPHRNSHLFESKSKKGAAMCAKWEIKWLWYLANHINYYKSHIQDVVG